MTTDTADWRQTVDALDAIPVDDPGAQQQAVEVLLAGLPPQVRVAWRRFIIRGLSAEFRAGRAS